MPLEGLLRPPRSELKTPRDWDQFLRRLNEQLKDDGERVVIDALATIASRTGTDIDTMLQLIGDGGRAEDQRFLPTVTYGNVASVQSDEPLTAVAGPTTANISIAAHTLHVDFDDISYNSGSVTGLALNTRYYIYVDDPDYEGGAVTYVASTSRPNVTADSGRYFVGTIETPAAGATAMNINAATSANPIELTTTIPHGWITGDEVELTSFPGDFAVLNSDIEEITVTGATTFTIARDGSLFAAYTSGGIATRVVADTGNDFGGGGGGYIP